jgi:2'-5' RNA ligase
LPRRAVVGFPLGAGIDDIERFRRDHDPLAPAMPAHVTLVFPFASSLSSLQIATHVRRVVARWPRLPLRLDGVGVYGAEWVHLRIDRGREALTELHDRLHRRALGAFLRVELPYEPHLTIGRARSADDAETIVAGARRAFARPIDLVLPAVSIVALLGDGVRPEVDVPLG